jgi:hypothetical protein
MLTEIIDYTPPLQGLRQVLPPMPLAHGLGCSLVLRGQGLLRSAGHRNGKAATNRIDSLSVGAADKTPESTSRSAPLLE